MKRYIIAVMVLVLGISTFVGAASYYAQASTTSVTVYSGRCDVKAFIASNMDSQDVTYNIWDDDSIICKITADANTTTIVDFTPFGNLFVGSTSTATFKVTSSTTPTTSASGVHWFTTIYSGK